MNSNTGTAVGWFGTILRTDDGGATWTSQNRPALFLSAVSFVDANTGTAVGADDGRADSGTILRTDDGGATWTRQSSGTNNYLYGVSFVDANTGTAVGGAGTILRTTTGGQ